MIEGLSAGESAQQGDGGAEEEDGVDETAETGLVDAVEQAVAEHAMALLLAVARAIVSYSADTRHGLWRRGNMHLPLRGKIIQPGAEGFGGRAFQVGEGLARGFHQLPVLLNGKGVCTRRGRNPVRRERAEQEHDDDQ